MVLVFLLTIIFPVDRPGLKGILEIQRLNQALTKALRLELSRTHQHRLGATNDTAVFEVLLSKSDALREISFLHMETLGRFRRSAPHLQFPDLHKELFSVDI